MLRWVVILVCVLAWVVLAAGVGAPLAGMVLVAMRPGHVATDVVAVPSGGALLVRSLTLSAVATLGAMVLGVLPAGVLAMNALPFGPSPRCSGFGRASGSRLNNARSGRHGFGMFASVLWGLVLAPLLVPPQVYAYAWGLVTAPAGPLGGVVPAVSASSGAAIRAGLISAGWLWPVVAMILAAGWRSTGRSVYALAVMDTSPGRAFVRAVLPCLRGHLVAAACLVFAVTLVEYPIPHLSLARVYATELMVLVDVGAPAGQVMRMAGQVMAIVFVLLCVAAWSVRSMSTWGMVGNDEDAGSIDSAARGWSGRAIVFGAACIWLASVGLPVWVMWRSLRVAGAWRQGFELFAREWGVSLAVALAAGILSVLVAVGTAVLGAAIGRRGWGARRDSRTSGSGGSRVFRREAASGYWGRIGARGGMIASFAAAMAPAAALGIGFVVIFNRAGIVGDVYAQTPVVWCLALTARYAAVAVLIAWLALGRRGIEAAEQARVDGAGSVDVLTYVLLPLVWPSLLAGGVMVTILSLCEVVVSQLVRPVGYPSIALAILGLMHYGRDDVVIVASLMIVGAGVILTQVCSGLLMMRRR